MRAGLVAGLLQLALSIAWLGCAVAPAQAAFAAAGAGAPSGPVVIIPGNSCDRLEGRWGATPGCAATSWTPLWIYTASIKNSPRCWGTHMALEFDPATNTSSDSPSVQVRAPGFGGTTGIGSLDLSSPLTTVATGEPDSDKELVSLSGWIACTPPPVPSMHQGVYAPQK